MNALTTEADNTPAKLFQAKVAERIRSDLGDLMPDEMIRQLVEDSIRAELYRNTNTRAYGEPQPWIKDEVRKACGEKIRQFAQEALEGHEGEIQALVKETIKDHVPDFLAGMMVGAIKGTANTIEFSLQNQMSRF